MSLSFSVKEESVTQPVTQSLVLDDRTCLLVFPCSVFISKSLMAVTAGWHCKQPSHLDVNGRPYVSTTESLPPSCSYMKLEQHPSRPPTHSPSLPALPPAERPTARWPRELCIISRLNTSRKPSRGVIVANVLQSKQFSYVNLIHSNTMQYVLTLLEHASPRVPFVLLWCIHSALWNTARMKLYTEPSQAEVTPPIIHPSCWQPSGRIILERLGRTPRNQNEDFW